MCTSVITPALPLRYAPGSLRSGGLCQGHAIGNYSVDFCAPQKKLIIELDGSQHLEQSEYDNDRTKYFESKGYRVLRFWNNDVTNHLDAVLKVIWKTLNE
ncbi:MAG TPA: endonuclease domain-containing protein [Anaerolineales bacterium]|nr:endonuclease domain-containing protein [Anaerolineales bacterium]